MKKIILTFMLTFSVCGYIYGQEVIRNEQTISEIQEIISLIKTKPIWLRESQICPSSIVPKIEKEVTFLDEGCEKTPKKCFENCKKGDGNSCYALALLIQVKTDIANIATNPLFTRACKLGIISACTNRAAFDLNNTKLDRKKAKCVSDTFEKSCKMNDSWGCAMYGMNLMDGIGREKNLDEAIIYLDKACTKFGLKSEACQGAMRLKKQIEEIKNTSPIK